MIRLLFRVARTIRDRSNAWACSAPEHRLDRLTILGFLALLALQGVKCDGCVL